MLSKLVKYDYKAMSKTMYPLFLAMLIISTIFSLMVKLRFDNGFVFASISSLMVLCLIASLFMTLISICNRFDKGLLKNEGYLSFALPVKTSTHIVAKVLNAFIWSIIEGIVLGLCLLVMGLIIGSIKEVAEFFKELFELFGIVDKEMILDMFKLLILMILELLSTTCLVYAAYAIGHLFNKHQKLIISFVIVFVSFIRTNLVIWPNTWQSSTHGITLIWYLIPIVTSAIYSIVTWYILDKKLNLE